MPVVGGATGHDGGGDPRDPRRGGGEARRPAASDPQRQRSGVRGGGGALVPGGVGLGALYVAPASPWQNGYAESFHSKLRDEFLEMEEFESVPQARALAAEWKEDYNTERPHSSRGYLTPAEFSATRERYMPIEEEAPDDAPSTEQKHG
jgi:transposase InsO family protein